MYFEKRTPIFLELGFREEAIPQLKAYIDHLWQSNETLNLVSRKMTFEELIDNHLIDSLLALKHFPKDVKEVADFGSGGGLPGVVYAIQFPEVVFHLYEKSKLKQEYLSDCKPMAPNLKVHGEIPAILGKIDLVVARAFKSIDISLDVSRNYYGKGGKYFFLKARREKIDEEVQDARKQFKDMQVTIEVLKSPVLEVERHLVLVQKTLA